MRRALLLLVLVALAAPAAASAAGTFVVVSEPGTLPGYQLPNDPGQIAVNADFRSRPAWVEQRSVEELVPLWQQAGEAYDIPWELLAAINKIETNFGLNMGPSSAGAVGWMQFMPETWLRWGTDADFDGVADPWDPEDGIYSAARYLAAAGGQYDIPRAVFAYNHADWYVNDVLSLASVYAGGSEIVPAFAAEPGVDLAAAERAVAEASSALARALAREKVLLRRERAVLRFRNQARLLSDRLLREKRLTQAGIRVYRAAGDDRPPARAARRGGGHAGGRSRGLPGHSLRLRHGLFRARQQQRLRLPGRRRPDAGLDRRHAPRLSGSRHRRADGRARVRARGRRRHPRLERARGPLRHRLRHARQRRPRMGLLPPVLHRAGGDDRRDPDGRDAGGARRLDGNLLVRPAPAPAADTGCHLPPDRALVPRLRRHRLQLDRQPAARRHARPSSPSSPTTPGRARTPASSSSRPVRNSL